MLKELLYTDTSFTGLLDLDPSTITEEVVVYGRNAIGDEGGGVFYWLDGNNPLNPPLPPQDFGTVFESLYTPASPTPLPNGRWIRVYDGYCMPAWFGVKNDGTITPQGDWDNFFNICKNSEEILYLPAGRYVLPAAYTFDFGDAKFRMIGEGIGNTILTQEPSVGLGMKIPKRLDLTKPRPQEPGIYQIDINGPVVHADYTTALTSIEKELDKYVVVTSSSVDAIALKEVKLAGYVTLVDVDATPPGTSGSPEYDDYDGLYVVNQLDHQSSGGSFPHYEAGNYSDQLVILGTILKRTTADGNATWVRFYTSNIFRFKYDLDISGITFENFSSYLFEINNYNGLTDSKFKLSKCSFEFCYRVCAIENSDLDYTAPGVMRADPSNVTPVGNGRYFVDPKKFNYRHFEVSDCLFEYIHQSIFWNIPPSRKIDIVRNEVKNCYTLLEAFYYYPQQQTSPSDYQSYHNSSVIHYLDNSFIDVRSECYEFNGGGHLLRSNGNAVIARNKFLRCSQTFVYASGFNNMIVSNFAQPYFTSAENRNPEFQGTVKVFHLKAEGANGLTLSGRDYIGQNVILGGYHLPFDIKSKKLSQTTIIDNDVFLSSYKQYITGETAYLDRNGIYCIKGSAGLTKFQSLAISYDAVSFGDYVRFDYRLQKWVEISNTIIVDALYTQALLSSNDADVAEYTYPVVITNNQAKVSLLFDIPGDTLFAGGIICENNQFYFNEIETGINSANKLALLRVVGGLWNIANTLANYAGSADIDTVQFDGVRIQYGFLGYFQIRAGIIATIRNCIVEADPKFNTSTAMNSSNHNKARPDCEAAIYLKSSNPNVKFEIIDNPLISSLWSRSTAIFIVPSNNTFDSVKINGNRFELFTSAPLTGTTYTLSRYAIRLAAANDTINNLTIGGNIFSFEPLKNAYVVFGNNIAYTLGTVTFNDNRLEPGSAIPVVLQNVHTSVTVNTYKRYRNLFKPGTDTAVMLTMLQSENYGEAYTTYGSGTATIQIPHGLESVPTKFTVSAANAQANGTFYITVDATNINVIYPALTNSALIYSYNWTASI